MDRSKYEAVYPKYCRKCLGWGLFKSLSPALQIQDCECVREDRCPRCGEKALNSGLVCGECDWKTSDRDRGLPGSDAV